MGFNSAFKGLMVKDTDVLHVIAIWLFILIANSSFHQRSRISHYLPMFEESLGIGAEVSFNSNENFSFMPQEL